MQHLCTERSNKSLIYAARRNSQATGLLIEPRLTIYIIISWKKMLFELIMVNDRLTTFFL